MPYPITMQLMLDIRRDGIPTLARTQDAELWTRNAADLTGLESLLTMRSVEN